jgi:hypothetical protein
VTVRGALVAWMRVGSLSVPNVVAFQFNPETLRHSWAQPEPAVPGAHPLGTQGMPNETFSFSLALDVSDQLELPATDPIGKDGRKNGLSSRLAALEMLLFPSSVTDESTESTGSPPASDDDAAVPAQELRTVLFMWGAGRMVPVRVTSLIITEKLFDANLNPTHADAHIELRVLTTTDLTNLSGPLTNLATAAYRYSLRRRAVLAGTNLIPADKNIDLPRLPHT